MSTESGVDVDASEPLSRLEMCDDGTGAERLRAARDCLERRSRLISGIRRFFSGRDFIEVETPVLTRTPALETHIDAERAGKGYLRTSPELFMKRLLAAGYERIFEIGQCFRNGEYGSLHNPEYTMLEWYRAPATYHDMMGECRDLICSLFPVEVDEENILFRGQTVDFTGQWHVMTISEAFMRFAGWDPVQNYDANRFNLDLTQKVEPYLPRDRPVFLIDYPSAEAALAKLKEDDRLVAERWELYVGGVEIANAFTELDDRDEQIRRFQSAAEARDRLGKDVYPVDKRFIDCLKDDFPQAGGVALGVDRLVMLFCGVDNIHKVRAFDLLR